jgi:putative toxin-antitoxin system antitoxin component (TIGR02293 family)
LSIHGDKFVKFDLKIAKRRMDFSHMAKKKQIYYSADNAALAKRVEEGVPVLDLVAFGKTAGFTSEELAKLIHVPSRTYARRLAGRERLKLDEGERAIRFMRVYEHAKSLFGTHENTRQWLNMKLPALGWRTPLDFARTEPGAREVESLINRIEDGSIS